MAQSRDWDRYQAQHERDLDWVFTQDQLRQQQRRIDEQLEEQRRQTGEMRRNQSSAPPQAPYEPPPWPR